jgi:hypothetical protein
MSSFADFATMSSYADISIRLAFLCLLSRQKLKPLRRGRHLNRSHGTVAVLADNDLVLPSALAPFCRHIYQKNDTGHQVDLPGMESS